jgi:hypothetical protein
MNLLISGPQGVPEIALPVYWTKGQLRCCDAREQRAIGYIVAALVPSDSGRGRPRIERVFARGLVAHSRTFLNPRVQTQHY